MSTKERVPQAECGGTAAICSREADRRLVNAFQSAQTTFPARSIRKCAHRRSRRDVASPHARLGKPSNRRADIPQGPLEAQHDRQRRYVLPVLLPRAVHATYDALSARQLPFSAYSAAWRFAALSELLCDARRRPAPRCLGAHRRLCKSGPRCTHTCTEGERCQTLICTLT